MRASSRHQCAQYSGLSLGTKTSADPLMGRIGTTKLLLSNIQGDLGLLDKVKVLL